MEKKIKDVAEEYIILKDEESSLKSKLSPVASALKKAMESLFRDSKEDTVETDIGVIKLTYRKNKPKYDEDGLIAYFKEKGISDVVKTKEYVDFDVLETLLYNERVDSEDIAKFMKQTTTPVLNIKRKKGE